jgi:regulator of sirC expression with transglutaminase-like and TPR domain
MNPSAINAPPAKPDCDARERSALVTLLGDDDPVVFAGVRKRIVSEGPSACGWLRPHALSGDPMVRRHAQAILQHFERVGADQQFLLFCLRAGEHADLESGALLLARTTHPEINLDAYRAVLDSIAEDLRPRFEAAENPEKRLALMSHYLFPELGFRANRTNLRDPRDSHLNRVLDRRIGNPTSLCLVYMLLAHRLDFPVAGIGLPGHFLCRHQSSVGNLYIDAFENGRVLTKPDCLQYLMRSGFGVDDRFLAPLTPRRMLMRLCGDLHQSYLEANAGGDAARVRSYLVALSRESLD